MSTTFEDLLPALRRMSKERVPLGLAEVGEAVFLSPGRAQRVFRRIVGESPKQYQLRVRTQRAASLLLTSQLRITDVATASGFASHEVFSRAFLRQFGISPRDYRKMNAQQARNDPAIVTSTAPCVGMYRRSLSATSQEKPTMTTEYTIEPQEIEPQVFLYGTRRLEKTKVSEGLAEVLPAAFGYAMGHGLEMTGPPTVRYVETTPAFVTIDAGVPLAAEASPPPDDSGLKVGSLRGGAVAFTVHKGPYENLADAYVAMDLWLDANDTKATGAPWEVYITDPTEVPDPQEWVTHVYQPI